MTSVLKSKFTIGILIGLALFIFSRLEVRYRFIDKIIEDKSVRERQKEEQRKLDAETRIITAKAEADRVATMKAEAERKAYEAKIAADKAETERIAESANAEAERKKADAIAISKKREADRIAAEKTEKERRELNARIAWERDENNRKIQEKNDLEKARITTNNIVEPLQQNNSDKGGVGTFFSGQTRNNTETKTYSYNRNTVIQGNINRHCIVAENIYFQIDGIVHGNITLKKNATLKVNGMLVGNVYNYGGRIVQNSKIQGKIYNY